MSIRVWVEMKKTQGFGMADETTMEHLQQEIKDLRALLSDVLQNDEVLEGYNEENLGHELRERIRKAIAGAVPEAS